MGVKGIPILGLSRHLLDAADLARVFNVAKRFARKVVEQYGGFETSGSLVIIHLILRPETFRQIVEKESDSLPIQGITRSQKPGIDQTIEFHLATLAGQLHQT